MSAAGTPRRLLVVGVDASGTERVRASLEHGDDPIRLLRRSGWVAEATKGVVLDQDPGRMVVTFVVTPATGVSPADAGVTPEDAGVTPRDAGLVLAPGEEPVVTQRLAVYAVVRSERGVLVTENSARTNAPGTWALPGGGVDPGEEVEAALHREVWEETGQRVRLEALATVATRHWVGRAPDGRLEDFHAVRLVYRARCDRPTEPVVHDVDGTTESAAWVRPEDVAALRIGAGWRELVLSLIDDAG